METIKISIDVTVNSPEEAQNFIKSFFNGKTEACHCITQPQAPAAQPQAPAAQPQAPAAQPQAPAAQPQAPAAQPQAPAAPAVSNITIEDVRAALVQKVNEHRAEIKAKLNELGAPSVTKLATDKYAEMLTFLNSL